MRQIGYLVLMLLLLSAFPVVADEVVLLNGDRISGTIKKLDDKILVIETSLSQKPTELTELKIAIEKVKTLSTNAPLEVHLKDGTALRGRITPSDSGAGVVINPEGLPPIPIQFANLVAFSPSTWSGNLRAGLSLTRGNSETDTFNAGLDLQRRTSLDRITLGAGYLFGRQKDPDSGDRKTTQDEWFVGLKYDYFFTEKLYGYGAVRIERDEIADLDLRLIAGVGAGYQWIEREDFNVSFEAGLAWLYEDFATGASNDEVSLRLAYHVDKLLHLYTDIEFFHDLELYPALSDPSDFFLTTQFGARTKLSKSLFAEAKLVIDHDATPAPGAEKTDYTWLFGVGVTF